MLGSVCSREMSLSWQYMLDKASWAAITPFLPGVTKLLTVSIVKINISVVWHMYHLNHPKQKAGTYDHRVWKTGIRIRLAVLQSHTPASEFRLPYVFISLLLIPLFYIAVPGCFEEIEKYIWSGQGLIYWRSQASRTQKPKLGFVQLIHDLSIWYIIPNLIHWSKELSIRDVIIGQDILEYRMTVINKRHQTPSPSTFIPSLKVLKKRVHMHVEQYHPFYAVIGSRFHSIYCDQSLVLLSLSH